MDKDLGIENPHLEAIMNRYRHLCDNTIPFPYGEEVDKQFLGRYFVFDLIAHHEACSELLRYVTEHMPRLHYYLDEDKE